MDSTGHEANSRTHLENVFYVDDVLAAAGVANSVDESNSIFFQDF